MREKNGVRPAVSKRQNGAGCHSTNSLTLMMIFSSLNAEGRNAHAVVPISYGNKIYHSLETSESRVRT